MLYLYKVSRDDWDYEDYDSFIVAEETEQEARETYPYAGTSIKYKDGIWVRGEREYYPFSWTQDIESLNVEKIGIVDNEGIEKGDIILSSFNAG